MNYKNNYPLPLILDIVEDISTKKYLLNQIYDGDNNNVQIKKEDG